MVDILQIIGRSTPLFSLDIEESKLKLKDKIESSKFLVLGGAGSIGQAVVKEIFKRNPQKLFVVDISENNLVELVRDVRSSLGYIKGDFQTFALDIGSVEFQAFLNFSGDFDYVLNLSALKHVRSEKDPFTLMRMINVNISNTNNTISHSIKSGVSKYFCVSTDKAANPVNLMGASKRIMEMFLMQWSSEILISTARFANVAFSDGSLLHGFNQRIQKSQPIVAPNDIRRYFVTPQESGELCLMSCILGENRDIFFPKLSTESDLMKFSDIAERYLHHMGYTPFECNSEEEARYLSLDLIKEKKWPCFFSFSDTTGEKDVEEFYTDSESLVLDKFHSVGIVKNEAKFKLEDLNNFEKEIEKIRNSNNWNKNEIVSLFVDMIPELRYEDVGKYLDSKM